LVNSATHTEISEQTVQTLIWAILARAKISSMSFELQKAAFKLLKPSQILTLNQGAVGFIPDNLQAQVLARVPDPLKPVFEAENSLRGLLASNATYQDLERVAVPEQPRSSAAQGPEIPAGRWSYDPHGFFVQYLPHGYQWTTTQIDVPPTVTVRRDSLGRVTSLADQRGDRIDVRYNNAGSLVVAGDAGVRLYHFQSVRFVWQQGRAKNPIMHEATWSDAQWIAVGVSSRGGRVGSGPHLGDAQARYSAALGLRDQFTSLVHNIKGRSVDVSELVTLAEFRDALTAAAGAHVTRPPWLDLPMDLTVAAWESALIRAAGGTVAVRVFNGADQEDDPSSQVGAPGDTRWQLLAQSPSCHQLPENDMQSAIGRQFFEAGIEKRTYGFNERIAYSNPPGSGVAKFGIMYAPNGVPLANCDWSHGSYYVTGSVSHDHAVVIGGDRGGQRAEGYGTGNTADEALHNALKDLHPIPHFGAWH
jgi:hypothetical protein